MTRVRVRPRILWVIGRWPRQSFALATALDALRRRLGRSNRPHYFQRRVILAAAWRPTKEWPFPCQLEGPDLASLRPPMILVSFHTGGGAPLNVLLTRLPARVLVLQYEPDRSPPLPGVERVRTAGGELARALAAKRAGDFLRAGGFVFMMLDRGGFTMLDRGGGAYTPIEVFNGRFFVSSGAFRLAQLTRAPILPVIAEWRGRGGEIRLGRPIAPAGEAEMSNMLAMWLEDLLPAGQARSKLISSLSG